MKINSSTFLFAILLVICLVVFCCSDKEGDENERAIEAIRNVIPGKERVQPKSLPTPLVSFDIKEFPKVIDKLPTDVELPGILDARQRVLYILKEDVEIISDDLLFSPVVPKEKRVVDSIAEKYPIVVNGEASKDSLKGFETYVKSRQLSLDDIGYAKQNRGIESGHVIAFGQYLARPYRIEIDVSAETVRINGVPVCFTQKVDFIESIKTKERKILAKNSKNNQIIKNTKRKFKLMSKHHKHIEKISHLKLHEAFKLVSEDYRSDDEVESVELKWSYEQDHSFVVKVKLKDGFSFLDKFAYGRPSHDKSHNSLEVMAPSVFGSRCGDQITLIIAALESNLIVIFPGIEPTILSRNRFRSLLAVLQSKYDNFYKRFLVGSFGIDRESALFLIANYSSWGERDEK